MFKRFFTKDFLEHQDFLSSEGWNPSWLDAIRLRLIDGIEERLARIDENGSASEMLTGLRDRLQTSLAQEQALAESDAPHAEAPLSAGSAAPRSEAAAPDGGDAEEGAEESTGLTADALLPGVFVGEGLPEIFDFQRAPDSFFVEQPRNPFPIDFLSPEVFM